MTNSKWLRSALLGGVAVSVMATGAQASELSDLKAQLESLQSRVNTIETAPALPAGTSGITMRRGASSNAKLNAMGYSRSEVQSPEGRGFTFAIAPTADLPAPSTEITISGFVNSWAMWNNEDVRNFDIDAAVDGTHSQIALRVRGRFRIRASTDTAIGQIRSLIEVEAYDGGDVYQRHALGEWDMTPNWTFQAGRTWATAGPLDYGVSLVGRDWQVGPDLGRTQMVRLRYTNGPIRMMFAVEDPTQPNGSDADYPNLAAHFRYNAAGGHQFWASGEVADYGPATGYAVNAGANISLGDIATLTTTATFGRGIPGTQRFGQISAGALNTAGKATKALGAGVGVSFAVSEATTINAEYGFAKLYKQAAAANTRTAHSVHANILWRPVTQMRLGWEARWGKEKQVNGVKNDVFGAAFGAWFFF